MLRLEIIGHVGSDAEVKNIEGRYVMSFSVAHTDKWLDKNGEKIARTTWVSCEQWSDKQFGVASYIKKGGLVRVSGAPYADFYTAKSGDTVGILRLKIKEIELLGGGGEHEQQRTQTATQPQQQPQTQQQNQTQPQPTRGVVIGPPVDDEDLPF